MIVFLTVSYIVVLLLAFRFKLLKPTLAWKLSPIVWVLLLTFFLFIPLQFAAPAGQLRIFENIVQIVPQVAGQVIEVPIQPDVPIKKGDVLFRIDPRPYQYNVDKLEAALTDASVGVARLQQRLNGARAAVLQAEQTLRASETDFDSRAREALVQASARVDQVEANLRISRTNFERIASAAASEAVSQLQLDAARREVESLEAQVDQAEAGEEQARLNYAVGDNRVQAVREQVVQAEAAAQDARLAYEAEIGGQNPMVRQISADLDLAQYNLEQTVVLAPADGYVVNLQLRPGSRVVTFPFSAAMTFIESDSRRPAVMLRQNHVRSVQPGQEVEISLMRYPGRIFSGRVLFILDQTASGQLTPSGVLPSSAPQPALPAAVRIEFGEEFQGVDLTTGVAGTAAIYTESAAPTHVIRRVMIRMDTWLNYLRGMSG